MNITPTYVTFEQAKLLKEKGFDLFVYYCYNIDGSDKKLEEMWSQGCEGGMSLEDWLINYNLPHFNLVSKPEQWQVIEWLRINHDIFIEIKRLPLIICSEISEDNYVFRINNKKGKYISIKGFDTQTFSDKYETPQEAYSIAIDYILKELLKQNKSL